MGLRVIPDTTVTVQRFDPGEEPRFVFAVGEDHGAWHAVGRPGSPSVYGRPELGRAVRVAVEHDQDRTTVRLRACKSHCSLQFRLACKLVAWPSNRLADLHWPNLRFRYETAQQYRSCVHVAMALHDWLNCHFALPAIGNSAIPHSGWPAVRGSGRSTGAARQRS